MKRTALIVAASAAFLLGVVAIGNAAPKIRRDSTVAQPGPINTNCGPICGGGTVCLAKNPDGSFVAIAPSLPILVGKAFHLDKVKLCWVQGA